MLQKAFRTFSYVLLTVCMIGAALPIQAKVTKEEAAQLKKGLTPFGAERAGNAEGTIPAWDGGLTSVPSGISFDQKKDKFRPDPFKDDKVLYTITAQNMQAYADKLSEGQKSLLKKYPNSYKMNVYPTRRTSAAPQWVYDNTYQNALNAEVVDRYNVTGAYGGIPFPIPKSGIEGILNHIGKWTGGDTLTWWVSYNVYGNGTKSISAGPKGWSESTYYEKNGSDATWDGYNQKLMYLFSEPTRRKGEVILTMGPFDFRRVEAGAWQYMPGLRRVRRAPNLGYDAPAPAAGGCGNYDDLYMYGGEPDRFDWKLVGKKECIIPYNDYQMDLVSHDDLLTTNFLNPQYLRWELHRVWIVEATLRTDTRHNYGRRIMHLDEDTWINVLMDDYDTRGSLWRTMVGTSKSYYDVPGVFLRTHMCYDLQKEDYAVVNLVPENEKFGVIFEDIPTYMFTVKNVRMMGLR